MKTVFKRHEAPSAPPRPVSKSSVKLLAADLRCIRRHLLPRTAIVLGFSFQTATQKPTPDNRASSSGVQRLSPRMQNDSVVPSPITKSDSFSYDRRADIRLSMSEIVQGATSGLKIKFKNNFSKLCGQTYVLFCDIKTFSYFPSGENIFVCSEPCRGEGIARILCFYLETFPTQFRSKARRLAGKKRGRA